MITNIKIYRCNKCSITKHIKSTEYFDGICKCCKNKMTFLGDGGEYDNNITPSKIEEKNRIKREQLQHEREHEELLKAIQQNNNTPKCPTCHSTNISKIGTLNRMVSVGLFGLASSKIGKTHKCNNCGATW